MHMSTLKVHSIGGQGFDSNIYLVDGEKPVLIDTGTGRLFNSTLGAIKKIMPPDNVERIILTHRHFDHTGGAADLARALEAPVFIYEDDAPPVEVGDAVGTGAKVFLGEQEPLEVSRLFDEDEIDCGDFILRVIHTPGHSVGSISLYETKTRSLFSGDTFFCNGGVGRWDLPSGNYKKLKESIERLNRFDIVNLYPGHDVFSEGDGQAHAEMALRSIGMSPFELMMRRA